jgi:bacteriocin-type transport-associated protein
VRKALFLLGILNDADLDWMIAAGARRDVDPGSILIREGSPVDAIFLVVDGLLAVRTKLTGDANIANLHSGEIVGEMSFVDSKPPSASVLAIEPSVVLAIPRTALASKLQDDVPFAARFYRALAVFLSDRLRSTVSQLGYGKGVEREPDDEVDPDTLDNVSLAGARFDWLQKRLKEI